MRTFIAIELPPALQPIIRQQQQQIDALLSAAQLGRHISWTPPEKAHLTLRFLGETTEQQRQTIQVALTTLATQQKPFTLFLRRADCFPTVHAPNIIWLGLEEEGNVLLPLQRALEQRVQAAGFAAEGKPFRPHLTIGRTKPSVTQPQRKQIGQVLVQQLPLMTPPLQPSSRFVVRALAHIQSQLQPTGARYTPLQIFNFG